MGITFGKENRLLEVNEEVWEFHPDYNIYTNLSNKPRVVICIPKDEKTHWGIFNCHTGDWSVAGSKEEAFQTANFILQRNSS